MHGELARHTRALARVERTPAAFRAAAERLAADAPAPIFPSIRVCPLLGFLDARETRVGCLAHPKATGGPDLRACGVYDVETCEAFLCPSHGGLTEREAAIVEAVTDWHLYGLVVPDGPFVRAALDAVALAADRPVELETVRAPNAAAALRALFALKEELAPGSDGHFAPFHRLADGAWRERGPADAAEARAVLLAKLGGDERSGNDVELLEQELEARLEAAVRAFGERTARGK